MKDRKAMIRIARLFVLVGVVAFLAGCSGGVKVSMSDRINDFVDAINDQDYSDIRSLCDDGARDYDTANSENFWSTYFTPGSTYDVSDIDSSGSSATAVITGEPEYSSGTTFTFTFKEEEGGLFEGSTFYIKTISIGSSTIFQ